MRDETRELEGGVNNPMTLHPSQPLKDGKKPLPTEQVSSKVGIDATRKFPYPPPAAPPRTTFDGVKAEAEGSAAVALVAPRMEDCLEYSGKL